MYVIYWILVTFSLAFNANYNGFSPDATKKASFSINQASSSFATPSSSLPPWNNWMHGPPCPETVAPLSDFAVISQDRDVQSALAQLQTAVVDYLKLVNSKLGIQVFYVVCLFVFCLHVYYFDVFSLD
jgi:hypothetical protein